MQINRKFYPYWEWCDYKAGMWRVVSGNERKAFLKKAYEFTKDAELYGRWMLRVVEAWPVGCEQHLTNINANRRAWIGRAACQLAINCPEDITRQAWGYLTQEEQDRANHVADIAIAKWETEYVRKNSRLH